MNYEEALKYIHSFLKFGSKPGLDRVRALTALNGNPQNSLRIVHVAGTNGKGTVSTELSNILIENKIRTALFTSPYITDFCERIQINGDMIPHDILSSMTQKYKCDIEYLNSQGIFPTEFELITAMAFDYFKKENCDMAVIEVGLGGLYDSTNIVESPEVSVITHIDYDHTDVLGDTIEEIALQKCGIIKENRPCVVYPEQKSEVLEIIKKCCEEKNSRMIIPDLNKLEIISSDISGSAFVFEDEEYRVSLAGYHQILNAVTTIITAKLLNISSEKIKSGIKKTVMPARVEVISEDPLIILDGGHNLDGASAFAKSVENIGKYVAVVSMMHDKDVDNALGFLLKNSDKVVATECNNPRAEKCEVLAEKCRKQVTDVYFEKDPVKAFLKAMEIKEEREAVCVCGSLYLAGDLRKFIKNFSENS